MAMDSQMNSPKATQVTSLLIRMMMAMVTQILLKTIV